MRNWILFIFSINSNLDKLCDCEDRFIDQLASSIHSSPIDFLDIIDHINSKFDFINLRLLYNACLNSLSSAELDFISNLAGSFSPAKSKKSLPRNSKPSASSVIISKCASAIRALGFSKERLDNEFSDVFNKFYQNSLTADI